MEIQYQPAVKIPSYKDVAVAWQHSITVVPEAPRVRMDDYKIVQLTEDDGERMIDFLRRFFFKDEPLNVEVGLLETDDDRCVELEEYALSSISDGMSLMAVSSTGEMVGVCLNGVGEPGHLEDMEASVEACPNPKFQKILRLLANVERQADVYTQFPDVDKMVEVRIISVDDAWRGRGIATALVDKTREIARKQGYPIIRVDCTSHFSAMAVARLGMECIYSLSYDEYKVEGCDKPVFTPALPHTKVTTYVQRV